ncbi:MAG: hypothetical protein V2I97_02420 [Desulfococcaceae bacterium]|jgi:hydroxymethylpyrimidine pyrophosphatase-like HAD family hydrolase|nr:hypothetical protein [Desulfococcaceae bacterium]
MTRNILPPACIFDLDGTLNHGEKIPGGLVIPGPSGNSFLAPQTVTLLLHIAAYADIFIATGRSEIHAAAFRQHFENAGLPIAGWILEHGCIVAGYPEWAEKISGSLHLPFVRKSLERLSRKEKFPIDADCYREDHNIMILFSGNGAVQAEHFLDRAAGILKNRFRTIAGQRKIAIIPKKGEKYLAFSGIFAHRYFPAFAAGDAADDLPLLQHAGFPLTFAHACEIVRNYVGKRGGFVSEKRSHAGTREMLEKILHRLKNKIPGLPVPGPRLPYEESEIFRPSRRAYLDKCFRSSLMPEKEPASQTLRMLAEKHRYGENMVLEVRMRDWGGECKALLPLLRAFVPLLPLARWCLRFRPERLGVENLKHFSAIKDKIAAFAPMPDNSPRFFAPGVPDSPPGPARSSVRLLLYDYPEDMEPWYNRAAPRLLTKHPEKKQTWFVNPMYLKISGARQMFQNREKKTCSTSRSMMAANLIGERDIRIAVQGFKALREKKLADSLILAPRVIRNPERNRMIAEALAEIGADVRFLSEIKAGGNFSDNMIPENPGGQAAFPHALWADTYGDLPGLYSFCCITYLGGGFHPRKRGFDPMESLAAKVPVITGPLYDYNRIAVDALSGTDWIHILPDPETGVADFLRAAVPLLQRKPDPATVQDFFRRRKADPLRIFAEIMTGLKGRE